MKTPAVIKALLLCGLVLTTTAGCGEPVREETPKAKAEQEAKAPTTKVEKQPVKIEAVPKEETPGALDAETQKKLDEITKSLGENFRSIKEIKSDILQKYMPGYKLHIIKEYNPISALKGPEHWLHSIAITPKGKTYLMKNQNRSDNIKDIVDFINQNIELPEIDEKTAFELAKIYALLRQSEIKNNVELRNKKGETKFIKDKKGYIKITFYIEYDPFIEAVKKCEMAFVENGKIEVTEEFFAAGSGYD